ncbi:MAG: UDP-N-acetylmuramoyl-L-alanine--D-glutamate ligase [Phycisphaerales bacterium]|nr:UDP-N-acetylmuramoyl-L-alanine--D-glutamate ligase [Phycisphaerales bacterium]
MNQWDGQQVYVMGLGRFGGGVGVTRYLAGQGAQVIVGDSGNPDGLAESIGQLQDLIDAKNVRLVFGEHKESDLDGVGFVVVNPAIPRPWNNGFISKARSLGIAITTEIEIAYRLLDPAKVIAVTGSAGKSTTCAMIHHALVKTGHRSVLGGNIGGSLLAELDAIERGATVVLELSSAMLYWLGESGVLEESPPRVGCVSNCVSNHLDWHGDAEHYEESKRVLAGCAERLVLGFGVADWGDGVVVSEDDALGGCAVPGKHNGINGAMAVEAAVLMVGDVEREQIVEAVRGFGGLPHRLQLVHEAQGVREGVRFYNDSKCTVPDATALAVEAIGGLVAWSKIHLIAGGYDKGSDLSLISEMSSELAGLYGIGVTGAGIVGAANGDAFDCGDLDRAMGLIQGRVLDGDVVLLSPGCASWDQFANYEERGDLFTELARAMQRNRV